MNLNENNFLLTLRRFAARAKGAEIALLYYAGHGMQDARQSYLLPVDVPGGDIQLVIRNSIGLDSLLRTLDGKAELTVAIFDACREIPDLDEAIGELTRDSGIKPSEFRGLARVKIKGKSRVVAYSGAAGQLVKDGRGRHSPYTEILLKELEQPVGEVDDLFQQVAWNFGQRYGGQNPEVLIQGVQPGRFYFRPGAGGDSLQLQLAHWSAASQCGSAACLQDYLNRYPQGQFTGIAHARLAQLAEPKPMPPPQPVPRSKHSFEPKMVRIQAGSFPMGSTEGNEDEKPVHSVHVSAFQLSKYEVTVAQFREFIQATHYKSDAEKNAGGKEGCWSVDWDEEKNWDWRNWASWRKPISTSKIKITTR